VSFFKRISRSLCEAISGSSDEDTGLSSLPEYLYLRQQITAASLFKDYHFFRIISGNFRCFETGFRKEVTIFSSPEYDGDPDGISFDNSLIKAIIGRNFSNCS